MQLQGESLDWALQHIHSKGDTDIFPPAFEFEAIAHCWDGDGIRSKLTSLDLKQRHTRPRRQCLTPKHRFGFRVATQLDPLDCLVFTSLVYEMGEHLEAYRIPKEELVVHSHRFLAHENGKMFDPEYGYISFQERSEQLADSRRYSHVVLADIADFFPRLYLHRLENALQQACGTSEHPQVIVEMIKEWNERVSYGIPVGPAASRLLSEVAIDDVDRTLLHEQATYVRFTDDYRIFCASLREAYRQLSLLAETLFESHGLTLQQHKTTIVSIEEFMDSYLGDATRTELASLSQRFRDILQRAGILDPYAEVEFDSLPPDLQREIEQLHLEDLLREQLEAEAIDIPVMKFTLQRLGQLNRVDQVNAIIGNLDKLYPVLPNAIRFICALRRVNEHLKIEIGGALLEALEDSLVAHLPFHRMWLLVPFTLDPEWDYEGEFARLVGTYASPMCQRKLILALGRSRQDHWFRRKKRRVLEMPQWTRRAFLAAGSCLPQDERFHWYRSLSNRLDLLEQTVCDWFSDSPF